MNQLILNTIFLALIQVLIPVHWLPVVSLARSEKWGKLETINIACISVLAHLLGTAVLVIPRSMTGSILVSNFESLIHFALPISLILFGVAYFGISKWFGKMSTRNFQFPRKRILFFVLILLMFLSPCVKAEDLYHAAATSGTAIILSIPLLYASINIAGTLLLIFLFSIIRKLLSERSPDRYSELITSVILVLVGVVTFLYPLN